MSANEIYGVEKFEGTFDKEEIGVTIIPTKTINDIKSPEALGVYVYLLARPSGWKLNPKQLCEHFDSCKDRLYRILNWLLNQGYITCSKSRHKGRFAKPHYRIHLHKSTEFNQKSTEQNRPVDFNIDQHETRSSTEFSPHPEKPDTVKPDTVFQDTYKTYNVYNIDNIKNPIVDFESTEIDNIHNQTLEELKAKKGLDTSDLSAKSDYQNNRTKNQSDLPNLKHSNSIDTNSKISKYYKDDDLFMRFYTLYPNKQKPAIAYKAFLRHNPDEYFVDMLISDLEMRKKNNWKNRHKSKIPFPATYLNGHEWEGEIYESESQDEIRQKNANGYGVGQPSAGTVSWI